MVVCKFFLQGTCKFGTHCHYDHQVPTNYSYSSNFRDNTQPSTSILRQSNFGNANNTQNAKPATTPANVDINTLVKAVATDMLGAEKGGQWLMSSYAPFKEKPEFPGFEDQSVEEIRFGFYEAQKNGTVEQYKQQLQMLLQSAIAKVRALQNPTPDICNILQQIYNTPVANSNNTLTQSIGNQQSSNIFATQNQSTFSQQQNTNIFAPKSIFGVAETNQATSNNVFANTGSSAPPNQNIFANSGFMGNQSSSNFGVPQNTNFGNLQPTNIFATQQTASTNVFAAPFSNQQQPTNIFATAPQQPQNIFGAQPISTPPSAFEHQKQQNIFAVQNQPLQSAQNNMFASQMPQQQTQNVFATNAMVQQNAVLPADYSASIFGNVANTHPGGFTVKQEVDESLYSKLEDLSEDEKKWFESDSLDILNIPDKPPTYEMCFKV